MVKPTIRDILPPENRPQKRRAMGGVQHSVDTGTKRPDFLSKRTLQEDKHDHEHRFEDIPMRGNKGNKLKYLYYGGGVVLGVLLISFLFSILFGGAEVTVHPKQNSITVSGEFRAVGANPREGELQYEIMTLEALLTKTVPATGTEDAEVKASGNIIVYNDFNSSPQRLIRNTRFETPGGLIYRIDKSVVVPGQSKEGGKTVPGTIEVTVYADEPGEKYNSPLTDFTIPGFKGAEQFEGFYARSKTEMKGGFAGTRLIVEESVLEDERAKLQTELEADLRSQVAEQKPEGFISFEDSVFVAFTSETPVEKGDDLEIREKAVLYNIIFKDAALAKYLAINTLATFDSSNSVNFKDKIDLNLSLVQSEDDAPIEPWKTGEFRFNISGNADIIWQFDEEALKNDLSGRNKEAIYTILSGYPSIDEAEVVIRPFWTGSFPENVEEIKIETVISE